MKFMHVMCAIGALATPATEAIADVLYTSYVVLGEGDYLATIDTSTGLVTTVGLIQVGPSSGYSIEALAWDSSSNTLYGYGAADGFLFEISPLTAEATIVGGPSVGRFTGMSYDPTREKLWGVQNSPSDGVPRIFEINRATGSFAVASDEVTPGSALAFLPTTSDLLIADPFPGSLSSWDPDTMTSSAIGTMPGVAGLTWSDTDNALYGTSDFGNVESNFLYTIDPFTGATINTIVLSEAHYYAALTAIPGPGAMGVLLVGGVATVRRRR